MTDKTQAMRGWVAEHVMKATPRQSGPIWYWILPNGDYLSPVNDWTPDLDANQRDMMIGKFDWWTLYQTDEGEFGCDVEEGFGFEESPGLACLTACAKASGWRDE